MTYTVLGDVGDGQLCTPCIFIPWRHPGPLIACSGWHLRYPLNFPLRKENGGKWGEMGCTPIKTKQQVQTVTVTAIGPVAKYSWAYKPSRVRWHRIYLESRIIGARHDCHTLPLTKTSAQSVPLGSWIPGHQGKWSRGQTKPDQSADLCVTNNMHTGINASGGSRTGEGNALLFRRSQGYFNFHRCSPIFTHLQPFSTISPLSCLVCVELGS